MTRAHVEVLLAQKLSKIQCFWIQILKIWVKITQGSNSEFCTWLQTEKPLGQRLQSGRSKYKTGVVSFLLCMTYHADITLTYFCIYNEFVTPILKTFVFLSRYPIYRLKPLMNNLRTLATHIDGQKWKIKIFCGRKIFMKSGPSFQHFHKNSHQKCHAILPHS